MALLSHPACFSRIVLFLANPEVMMEQVNAQMVLKLHQMSGEPVAHCNYLLTQTNGNYELALKILERILEQRKAEKAQEARSEQAQPANPAAHVNAGEAGSIAAAQPSAIEALEHRVYILETQFALLADSLDTVSEKLTALLDKVSGSNPS